MAKKQNQLIILLIITFILIATTSKTNGQSIFGIIGTNITQVQVIGSGLTCSNPSPFFLPFFSSFQSPLSGATVGRSCNGGAPLNTTSTTSSGNFNLVIDNPLATTGLSFLSFRFNCRVVATVPPNCTIGSFFFQPITVLRSIFLNLIGIQTSATCGQTLVVSPGLLFAI